MSVNKQVHADMDEWKNMKTDHHIWARAGVLSDGRSDHSLLDKTLIKMGQEQATVECQYIWLLRSQNFSQSLVEQTATSDLSPGISNWTEG